MLNCQLCSATYEDNRQLWRCPDCGGHLSYWRETPPIIPQAHRKRAPISMWHYASALPLDRPGEAITMGEGRTPLITLDIDGETKVKLDFLCPTGSYKDRGISLLVSRLKELGVTSLVEDSSGNAGASMAAYCARAGISCRIFVPSHTSEEKCVQIESAGATLIRVPGLREAAAKAAQTAGESNFYGSHNWSPWFVEGVKTFAYEIWDDMGLPDHLVLPAGQGSLILGAYRAFCDLQDAQLVHKLPTLHAVQSLACDPIVRAMSKGLTYVPQIRPNVTVAEGIASAQPLRGKEILQALRHTGGSALAVSDDETTAALFDLARMGIYVEPTSAVVVPAIRKLREKGIIKKHQSVATLLSGSGLKATETILKLYKAFYTP
ncbi:MAG: threonine synthase [Dethiosulfovibrio peptidovorans]|nr:MAG: threonine synthase [Dethiosulfovibrio peptidovorans]